MDLQAYLKDDKYLSRKNVRRFFETAPFKT